MKSSGFWFALLALVAVACNSTPAPADSSTADSSTVSAQLLPVQPPKINPPPVVYIPPPPQVIASNPTNNMVGVSRFSSVLLTFDQPMDTASVQAALSMEVNRVKITPSFVWTTDAKMLKFFPPTDFPYGALVDVYISSAARSATQEQMRPFLLHFTAVNLYETRLFSSPALDGHVLIEYDPSFFSSFDYDNVTYANEPVIRVGDRANRDLGSMGFMSFDLSNLPTATRILTARLVFNTASVVGNPGSTMGGLRLVSHSYGTLDGSDLDPSKWNDWCHDPNRAKCAVWIETKLGLQVADVTGMVTFDMQRRSTNGQRSQLRLYYNTMDNNNDLSDYVDITSGNSTNSVYWPSLSLTYEAP